MTRTRIYLLMTGLAVAALAASYALSPGEARGADRKHLWETFDGFEKCSGSCGSGQNCCTVIPAPAP
jgi:uncharacterized membrane protein